MKLNDVLFFLILPLLISCQPSSNKKAKLIRSKLAAPINENLEGWVTAINGKNQDLISQAYQEEAVKVISADSVLKSADQIAEYYTVHATRIDSFKSIFQTAANEQRGIDYEIIEFITEYTKKYTQLIIWQRESDKNKIAFEFTAEQQPLTSSFVEAIKKRRDLWIQLCNAHNAENLVRQLYSSQALYYNHKPIINETAALIKEYGYMNNGQYSLKLQPSKLIPVNERMVFEIGQCEGSYNGKYVLIWKKEADSVWRIFIDSNV